jgi:Fe-S-cluster-containing hydrogenase component 2
MKRKIISIDEELCNGCKLCVNACHEGAIQMINGKAKLVSDKYCDGLGDCLPACPTGAIEIIEREAVEYSQEAVDERMNILNGPNQVGNSVNPFGFEKPNNVNKSDENRSKAQKPLLHTNEESKIGSELQQWPVQLRLINSNADYLKNADILIAADCTAYAYGDFHRDFIKGRVTIIACPKLDDNNYNVDKLTEIFINNEINSITVVKMEVPCCSGMTVAVKKAMLNAQRIVTYNEVTIKSNGEIL